nr:MAG: hypothetical protein 1 [Triatovirus sp.]
MTTKTKLFEEKYFPKNLEHKRHHPFYADWDDWCYIASKYHSMDVTVLQAAINKGYRSYLADTLCQEEEWLVDEIYFQTNETYHSLISLEIYEEIKFGSGFQRRAAIQKMAKELNTRFYLATSPYICNDMCECTQLPGTIWKFPMKDCMYREEHLRSHILAHLWAWYSVTRPRRQFRKYYTRLQRVILSLPAKYLQNFTPELITRPQDLLLTGRSLLRELYDRAYFDDTNVDDIVQRCEELKHLITKENVGEGAVKSFNGLTRKCEEFKRFLAKEQGPISSQCERGGPIFSEEMVELADSIFSTYAIEQGFMNMTHTVSDEQIKKLQGAIVETQEMFLQSLGDTIVSSGKTLMVLFATAATVSLIAQFAMTHGLDLIMKLLHMIYSVVFGPEESKQIDDSYRAVQQGGFEEISVPFLPAMILNHVIAPPKEILNSLWHNSEIDRTMRRLGYLGDPKIQKGLERCVDWVRMVITRTYTWFCREILGFHVPEDVTSNSHVIIQWNREIDEVIQKYYANTLVWSETTWSVLYNLYSRGLTITRSPAYAPWKFDVWKQIIKLGNILEKFKQHARDSQTIRNPPVTLYLYGGTGVGKSSVTYPLAAEILKGIFEKEESPIDLKRYWKSLIYMRSSEQEFWDGYENQMVTVFDDFNQQADSASNPNLELFEIIRASNCFPYPLHMASLDQKANTTFSSKIILVSSNLEKPKTQSLNFPDALARRFDVCVRVSRKAQYQDYRGDFNPTIYDFDQYDMMTGESLGPITYAQLVQKGIDEYFSRRSFVDSVNNYIEKVLAEPQEIAIEQGRILLTHLTGPSNFEFSHNGLVREAWSPDSWIKDKIYSTCHGARSLIHRTTRYIQSYISGLPYVSMDVRETELWHGISSQQNRIAKRYNEMAVAYAKFQEEHPYLVKFASYVALLFAGLAFLKLFQKFKVSKKNSLPLVTEEGFVEKYNLGRRMSRAEAYNPSQIRTARVESYSQPQIKMAKVESYAPTAPRLAKVEAVVYDPATGLPIEQGVKDLNAAEIMLSIARRNLYKMYETTTGTPIGHVFFLRGKIVVMPKHFLNGLNQALRNDPDARVYFKSALLSRAFEAKIAEMIKSRYEFESPEEGFGPVASRDCMAMIVEESIIHPDAVPYFCDKGSLSRVDSTEVMMPVMVNNDLKNSERDILLLRFRQGRSALQRIESLPVGTSSEVLVRYIRDAWRYEADTEPTECGAPVIVRNTQITGGKICGFHIAGIQGTGEGFATPFYKEDALRVISHFPQTKGFYQTVRAKLNEYPVEQGQVPSKAEFVRLGRIGRVIAQPSKTKIEPSLVHGEIKPPHTRPCQLRPNDTFDPRGYRLERLGNVTSAIDSGIIENSKGALLDELSQVIARSEEALNNNIKAVYTFEEAILGIDGELFVNSIKRDTSPGFPFVHLSGMTKRTDFFGESEEYVLGTKQCEILRSRVENIIFCAKRGEVLDHYFVDTLKDERKPIQKAHKTRLFSAGPLDYLVACKMYFNGVVALLEKTRNRSHISVGTNPYSEDWGEIVKELHRKSDMIIAGDFEGFDASQHQRLLEAAGEIFVALSARHLGASEEDQQVMRVLLVSCYNSMHITGDEAYQWTHSLPSGHYLTAPINSVFVNLSFACIWQICFEQHTYMHAARFWRECGLVAYGDDHILSVPPSRIEKFNQLTIPGLFQQIGLSYTMEDKDAVATRPYRNIFEISYLKRGFYRDELTGKWLAPLQLETILETPMWIHKSPDARAQTIENLEFAIKELSLHPVFVWEQWHPVLCRVGEKLRHYTNLRNHNEVRYLVCSST